MDFCKFYRCCQHCSKLIFCCNSFRRPAPRPQRPTTLSHGEIYYPKVPQPQNGPRYASTPKEGPALRAAKLRQEFLNDQKNSSFNALMNQKKYAALVVFFWKRHLIY